jgi:RNA polymerase primary sigma factor
MRQLKINRSITNRDSASLDKYLSDISKVPMITADEETILAGKIRNGDQEALQKLVSANLRFVVSVAKQYQNQGISLPDLINEGNAGLIKAASRFDETRGFKFISYAVWWIRQSIMQSISEQSRIIRLPLNKIGALNRIRKAQSILEQELERQPTNSEIAAIVEMSEKEIELTRRSAPWHISTDSFLPGQDDVTVMDTLFDAEDEKPDHSLIIDSLRIEIDRALETLTEREKSVVIQFYGIGGINALTLEEMALKYELTRERVRQIKEKAIRKLKFSSRNRHLLAFL